ncbi:hypothetical protein HUX62_28310, partial [Massilia sp. BJB1822]
AGDGSTSLYTYDAAAKCYRTTDGAGAYDTLAYDSTNAQWLWTSGDTRATETYDANKAGRIIASSDLDQNRLSYEYNTTGLLSRVSDANGQAMLFKYSGNNLTEIETTAQVSKPGFPQPIAVVQTRIRYEYDSNNRLSRVLTDLSPEDGAIADGKMFWTRYSYDGNSKRVSQIEQEDGSTLNINYRQVNDQWCVSSWSDSQGNGAAANYINPTKTTGVSGSDGKTATYYLKDNGQFSAVNQQDTLTSASTRESFEYDVLGNVSSYTDRNGN